MRIVVTGAGGFVGANLARALAHAGAEVEAWVRPEGDPWRLAGAAAEVREVDLRRPELIGPAMASGSPDAVVHGAAHGAYSWQTDLDTMAAVNVVATAALVDAALDTGVDRFVHLGTSSEYGYCDHAPSELERLAPNSAYAVTKAAGTHLVTDAVRTRGLAGVVLRLYSVYGPWEQPGRLMPTLAAWANAGRLPPTLVEPSIARDFVHVDDVGEAVRRCLRTSGLDGLEPAIINVGSGRQTTLGELVEVVRSELGVAAEPKWGTLPPRAWDTTTWQADVRRAGDVLGWSPSVSLAEGLRGLKEFVARHPDRYAVG